MREAGRLVAQVLRACSEQARIGTSLHELDEIAAGSMSATTEDDDRPRSASTLTS